MENQTNFFDQVYQIVTLIPFGRVTSYGAIANALGAKGSARLVGYAMNDSHKSSSTIPAHRVVNRNGLLTGKHHFGINNEMQKLLESEGHKIIDDKIESFASVFWDPQVELSNADRF